MLELRGLATVGVEDHFVKLPADDVLSYSKVQRLVFLGENFVGPFYSHMDALEVNLRGGEQAYVADVAANRILLDINKLD